MCRMLLDIGSMANAMTISTQGDMSSNPSIRVLHVMVKGSYHGFP